MSDLQSGAVHNEYCACPATTKLVTGKAKVNEVASNAKVGLVRFRFSAYDTAKFRWADATAATEARRAAVYVMIV